MPEFEAGQYDIAVIGAGHAGIEAALAGARLGKSVILFTINLDAVGNMPCNPSIGGTAKGHLVREIDALGGEMARAADETAIQRRMLNLGKGPAVHSLRVQSDRRRYQMRMKKILEETKNLDLRQAEITEIRVDENKNVCSVVSMLGGVYNVKAVIIATGTYLQGAIHIGEASFEGGPDGMFNAKGLSESLLNLGVSLRRFKTGTPARIHKDSIDFSKLEKQEGDSFHIPFSFDTPAHEAGNQEDCYICYTNENTHKIILDNLSRSPLYGGRIQGIGPRYCPSIEDKVVRFSDKPRHQLFIEPMGLDTREMYLQGMSSSLPEDVQLKMMRSIKGLENIRIMRPAYAIEYDCVDPLSLLPSLEFKDIGGLYGAGQFNGTSGYEEAAAQGLIAGINASRKLDNLPPVILDRASSYIGTLIDDLVTKGTNEPYRMMTSRSEYRLILRQDNADERLMKIGYEVGLVPKEKLEAFLKKEEAAEMEIERVKSVNFAPTEKLGEILEKRGSTPLKSGVNMAELIRRPEITYDCLAPVDKGRPELPFEVKEQVEIRIKYEGYIRRQLAEVDEMRHMERRKIPEDIDYSLITGLRIEARQKLSKIRPQNLGQASRISGVSPADVGVLMCYIRDNM